MAKQSIWSTDPSFWPKAPRDFVFLAAAFQEVGRILCGEDWTGREAWMPETPMANTMRQVSRAPVPIRSIAGSRSTGAAPVASATPRYTPEEAQEARKRLNEKLEAERVAAERWLARRYQTAGWIAEKARNAELVTYGLWTGGGFPLVPLPAAIWNRANDWDVFADCEVKTYVPPATIACNYFVFLSRESLDRALSPRVGTASAERQAERWLRERFSDPTTKPIAKAAFEQEALARFSGLSGEGFERSWAAVTPDFPERARAGRKRAAG